MNELKIGKRYTYKNHVYEIVNLGRMKPDKDWVDSVGYRRVLEDGDEQYEDNIDTTTIYTRSRAMFEELFLPRTLELGDRIIAVSMGKTLRDYTVEEIDDNYSVHYKPSLGGLVSSEPTTCNLISNDIIGFNGRIYINHPDDSLSHINCVEYYFMSNKVRKIITRKEKIENIRSALMTIHEVFGKIDIANFRADNMLDKYSNELSNFITEIQKDGYIKWLQYKKQ